jgi:hypothetical protein
MKPNYIIDCVHCELKERRTDSVFCSEECKQAFIAAGPPESIQCELCDNEADGIKDAERDGWVDIELNVEGYPYNYLGLCPDCQKEAG